MPWTTLLRHASSIPTTKSRGAFLLPELLAHLVPKSYVLSTLAGPAACPRTWLEVPSSLIGTNRTRLSLLGFHRPHETAAWRSFSTTDASPVPDDAQTNQAVSKEQQQKNQPNQHHNQQKKLAKGRKKPIEKMKQRLKEMHEKPPSITYAFAIAHYLGKELNMKSVRESFSHAFLHVAPDYCLLYYKEPPYPSADVVTEDQSTSNGQGDKEMGADDVSKLVPLEGSMAVFSSGSVVFYGSRVGSKEKDKELAQQERWLKALESHVSRDSLLDGTSYSPTAEAVTADIRQKLVTEEVKLQVGGGQAKKIFTKGPDLVVLQQWDLGTAEILSRVMAQSVAIDVYTSTVDQMLWRLEENLDKLRKATHKGPLQKIVYKVVPTFLTKLWQQACVRLGKSVPAWQPDIDQRELTILLTDASTLEIRLMSKLGLMDKSHTPWESDKHDIAWQGLRLYFDIEKRQGQVEKKMGKITTKTNDMLETRRSTQTHYIENVITILIAFEIVMGVIFHVFDGGVSANTASTAAHMEQLVQNSNQMLGALSQQQVVISRAAEGMQAVQQSLVLSHDPAAQEAKMQQASELLGQAVQVLSELRSGSKAR